MNIKLVRSFGAWKSQDARMCVRARISQVGSLTELVPVCDMSLRTACGCSFCVQQQQDVLIYVLFFFPFLSFLGFFLLFYFFLIVFFIVVGWQESMEQGIVNVRCEATCRELDEMLESIKTLVTSGACDRPVGEIRHRYISPVWKIRWSFTFYPPYYAVDRFHHLI